MGYLYPGDRLPAVSALLLVAGRASIPEPRPHPPNESRIHLRDGDHSVHHRRNHGNSVHGGARTRPGETPLHV